MSHAWLYGSLIAETLLLAAVGTLAWRLWLRLRGLTAVPTRPVERAEPSPRRDGPTLIAVPDMTSKARPAPGSLQPYADIWALADGGLSPAAIASRTGTPVGQVELILGLRQRATEARS